MDAKAAAVAPGFEVVYNLRIEQATPLDQPEHAGADGLAQDMDIISDTAPVRL